MSGSPNFYPREGIITFLAYLVLLPICAMFFLTLFGWMVGVAFGGNLFQLIRTLPGFFEVGMESFSNYIRVSIALFAIYFGVRAALSHYFGQLEAALVTLILPFISMTVVDSFHSPWQKGMEGILHELTADIGDTIAGLLPALASVLFCRYLLVKTRVLHRQVPTP